MNIAVLLLICTQTLGSDINFSYDYATFKHSDSMYSLRYYYEIPYTKLFFFKRENSFISSYQLTIQIFNRNELVAGKLFKKDVSTDKYEDTKLQNYINLDSVVINFYTKPSQNHKFVALIKIIDLNSSNIGETQFDFTVPYFAGKMQFYKNQIINPSHIFSSKFKESETLNITMPIYSDKVKNCSLWFDKISPSQNITIQQSKTSPANNNKSKLSILRKFTPVTEKITNSNGITSVKYIDFSYPLVNLSENGSGGYRITIIGYDFNQKKVFEAEESLSVKNAFFYLDIEFFEMVNRLLYIATESEMKQLKQSLPSVRESLWDTFWKQHDPNPTTEINEMENEYFVRIDYCIQNFSKGDKGYKSDRAKIYMKHGHPDFVESQPFERNSNAYEIWSYYNVGKQFTFIDSHGFGEFILYQETRL